MTNEVSSSGEEIAKKLQMREIAMRLRERREISDATFDEIYPLALRRVSGTFWTPISVALRAVDLLVKDRATRVLDIGSGAGKFCIVGSAASGASFVGVEHREHLVRAAATAAEDTGTTTAHFFHGNFDIVDIDSFDAVYLFNPFEENLWDIESRLDRRIDLSEGKFDEDVRTATAFLSSARPGTRVVTYHGFGAPIPAGFRRLLCERQHSGYMELWLKAS